MFDLVRDRLYSILLPQQCSSCGELLSRVKTGNACDKCWARTRLFDGTETICARCGKPLPNATRSGSASCWLCDGHFYDKARAAGIYESALAATVVGLKSDPKLSAKPKELLLSAFERNGFEDATLIIPIPLSKQRKLERGFNQAEVISEVLSKAFGINTDFGSLVRTRHSPIHRIGMDQKARDLSVKNAFEVVRPKLVTEKNVLLVDDVFTTGATASYCAKALKKAGASKVNVITLARAVTHDN